MKNKKNKKGNNSLSKTLGQRKMRRNKIVVQKVMRI
jgi:hypothetical protein